MSEETGLETGTWSEYISLTLVKWLILNAISVTVLLLYFGVIR